jgi:hypothetical protein
MKSTKQVSSVAAATEPKATTRPTVSAQRPKGAPAKAKLATKATPAKKADASQKPAAKGKAASKKASPAKATGPRPASKSAQVLELIARPNGATAAEIQKKMKWLPHTLRGFLSIASKKYGLKIESAKNEAGERVYKS